MFLGSGGRNKPNVCLLVPIHRDQNFSFSILYVQKVGVKCFWAQEAETSLIGRSLVPNGEIKIFHEHDVNDV